MSGATYSIAIDGACRRNGQPNCVAAAGVFIRNIETSTTHCLSNYEIGSTNQRGELIALLTALEFVERLGENANIITDSEYMFNTVTKEWYKSWARKGWVTSTGSEVKNRDLWEQIAEILDRCDEVGIEVAMFHIKGHCIPFGKVTANELLQIDSTGNKLMLEVAKKYDAIVHTKRTILDAANELSTKNNGFEFTPDLLRKFVVYNVVADAIATKCVDTADMCM